MANVILAESNTIVRISIVVGVLAGGFLLMRFINLTTAYSAKWKDLVNAFPADKLETSGDIFKSQTAFIYRSVFPRDFKVRLMAKGMQLEPSFARGNPILVPWSKIDEVMVPAERGFGLQQKFHLNVDWYNRLQVSLPQRALPIIKKFVPADRFKVDSYAGGMLQSKWSATWSRQIK